MTHVACSICGKLFVPAVYHTYKTKFAGRTHLLCGYNCHMAAERVKSQHCSKEYQNYLKELKL